MSSSATAQVHIDRALRLIGKLPSGSSPTTQEGTDALIALNAMVGKWIADRDFGIVTLTTYATVSTSQTLPDGYDQALAYNLAVALAPEYEVASKPEILEEAARAFAFIRRAEAPAIAETAAKIITKALRIIRHLRPDEAATTKELAYGLDALNTLIGTWRTEKLLVYSLQDESLTLSSSTASYTIGPTGTLVTTRPVRIESAYILEGTQSYPVSIMEESDYLALPVKTQAGDWPNALLYRPTNPNGTILVYPVPNATRTLKLQTWVAISTFAATSTAIAFPPGYERALTYGLARDIAPEYGKELPPDALSAAREAKAAIKRANIRPARASTGLSTLAGNRRSNILSDQP